LLFNSYSFVYMFLPVALAGYYLAVRFGRRPAIIWLALASLVFYGWWTPAFVPLLGISIAFNYAMSRLIGASAKRPRLQSQVLLSAVAANLGALIYYKYAAWLIGLIDASQWFGMHMQGIVLPLGISFFTFTQIGYLIDCRDGIAKDHDLLDYVAFVTFFPHLIAGPILHNGEMMPQYANPATYRFDAVGFAVGLATFLIGMLKKCLLADPIGACVPIGYAHPADLSMVQAWQTVLSYSLQLYFDFSGYSDMAVGLALMFNLRFPRNFNSPYKATSVVDYWQRWHMTLTRYFTQYIYNPLAMAAMRRRVARRLPINRQAQMTVRGFTSMVGMPILVTIVLAGIWHGAGAQFIVFGLLHATYLIVNRACRIVWPRPAAIGRSGVVWRVALTYSCVLIASVFFRAPSVSAALTMLGAVMGQHGSGFAVLLPQEIADQTSGIIHAFGLQAQIQFVPWQVAAQSAVNVAWIAGLYCIVWALPNTQQLFAAYHPVLDEVEAPHIAWLCWRPNRLWAVALGMAASLAAISIGGTGEFLYFQF
jgi:alginate O-acetyltransferase complex protein AlgI